MSEKGAGPSMPASLLDEPPLRALVRLAAPTTAVMSIAALQQVLYTYFISHLGSIAIASVALVFPIALILTTVVGGGIGSGVASAVARALGAGRPAEARKVAEHSFALTTAMSVVFTAGMLLFERPIFTAMGAKGEVLDTAIAVSQILFGGLAIAFFIGTCDSIMRGTGNVRTPALCSTLSLVMQIILTPVLMFGVGLGIRGAPMATILGQLIGSMPRLPHVFGRRAIIRARLWPAELHGATMSEILRVGVPASLGTLINYLGMMALTAVMARFGTAELAAYGLCSRFDFVLLTICYGSGVAVLTLVGFATGSGRAHLVSEYAGRAVALLVSVIAVPTVLFWIWPELWLGLFTDDPAIRDVGRHYFRTVGVAYPLMGVSMTLAFAFQGIGRALMPLLIGVIRTVVLIGGAVLLTAVFHTGITAVFVLITATAAVSSTLLAVAFLRLRPRAEVSAYSPESVPAR